jgi:sulfate adenylyltransferase subunit 1 (EFTu-like GTPase family)
MLTGASHADAGILIVSAKEGIEEQTGQHLRLAQWLGLEQLIVAVNKMDLVGYDQNVFEETKDKIAAIVGNGLSEKIAYVPVSAYEGDNVVSRSPKMSWYRGETLYELMENLRIQIDLSELPFRLPVQDLLRGDNGEQIIVGRVESGSVQAGQSVIFCPSGATAMVKMILTFNKNKAVASAGENVAIVYDPDPSSVKRGGVCCPLQAAVSPKEEVIAHAIFLEPAPQKATVECGTAQTDCEIKYLSQARIGEVTEVGLRFKEPMVVERSRTALGRLALKHHGKIIGVAVVMGVPL